MAHISEYKLKDGTTRYRAHVHRLGRTLTQSGFPAKKDAKRWANEQDRSILLTGLPATNQELNKRLVSYIIEKYRDDEVTKTKGSYVTIKATLDKFLDYDICKLPLGAVKPKDAYEYIAIRKKEKWRGKPIKNSTIRRDVTSIRRAFDIAKGRWGFDGLINPFANLDYREILPRANNRRKRRLKEGELERLEQACEKCLGLNRFYVPLAIYLAIDTGMRLQEIFNLTWQDVDVRKRRIEIRKSKTDHLTEYAGRTIVLPFTAMFRLLRLETHLMRLEPNRYAPDARIFPMTKQAFKQSWADVRKRAGIKDLTFHDLRHEAASRFDETEPVLSKPEHNLMMGHASKDMHSVYVHSDLKRIQDKLDRHVLGGKTFDEWMAASDDKAGLEQLADVLEGKAGVSEELRALVAQDLSILMPPRLKAEVAQVLKGRRQKAAANVVQFSKAKAS